MLTLPATSLVLTVNVRWPSADVSIALPLAAVPTQVSRPDPAVASVQLNCALTTFPSVYFALAVGVPTAGAGALRSTLIGPMALTRVQRPSRSQTLRVLVNALSVSVPSATFVLSSNSASPGAARPASASARQLIETLALLQPAGGSSHVTVGAGKVKSTSTVGGVSPR